MHVQHCMPSCLDYHWVEITKYCMDIGYYLIDNWNMHVPCSWAVTVKILKVLLLISMHYLCMHMYMMYTYRIAHTWVYMMPYSQNWTRFPPNRVKVLVGVSQHIMQESSVYGWRVDCKSDHNLSILSPFRYFYCTGQYIDSLYIHVAEINMIGDMKSFIHMYMH